MPFTSIGFAYDGPIRRNLCEQDGNTRKEKKVKNEYTFITKSISHCDNNNITNKK